MFPVSGRVAHHQTFDHAINAVGVDLLCKAGAVVNGQTDAFYLYVIDLPGITRLPQLQAALQQRAAAIEVLHPVVLLERLLEDYSPNTNGTCNR